MSESVLTHPGAGQPDDYLPEEHAPDPVVSHGDPTRPGKVAIWLFLASEIMFFIGILGSYIILRSSSPGMFSRHGETLSKALAGVNTLVLIFSSLTMALAVDAAQKGNRGRTLAMLGLTLLCAFGFMGIKTIEYSDKAHHRTLIAKQPDNVVVKAEPGQQLYLTAGAKNEQNQAQLFNAQTAKFEAKKNASWAGYVIPVAEDPASPGSYRGKVPAGAARPDVVFTAYQKASAEPDAKDKAVKLDKSAFNYAGGLYVYDGHVHYTDAGYDFHGYRAPYSSFPELNLHRLSESEVKNAVGAKNLEHETIAKADVGTDMAYGPWKNNFFACYYALTGVHGLHVVGGMIPMVLLGVQALRGKLYPHHTEYTGLYWHFVDLVWIFLFPLLYLI